MDVSTRIMIIQAVRDAVLATSWDDQELVLRAFDYDTASYADSYGPSAQDLLNGGTDEQLVTIAQHFKIVQPGLPAQPQPASMPTSDEPLFLFASHLVAHRALLGQVAEQLKTFGITLFVAHSSIAPDSAWYDEIIKALRDAHGGVAFLHDGFKDSAWCDQEVGWLLGREVPVFSMMFGGAPYGPLGKWQAVEARKLDARGIASTILDVSLKREKLRPNLTASLVQALRHSYSFNMTDLIWVRLRGMNGLTDEQCTLIMDAMENNNQVAGTKGRGPHSAVDNMPYGRAIAIFLRQQPGVGAIQERLVAWEAEL